MDVRTSLREFQELHARAQAGVLSPEERARYRRAREECARILTAAQNRSLAPGQVPRRTFRVGRALPVQIDFPQRTERTVTLELSPGGFGAFVGQAPARDDVARIALRVPGGEPIACAARVVGIQKHGAGVRASFEFLDLQGPAREQLEIFLVDAALQAAGASPTPPGKS